MGREIGALIGDYRLIKMIGSGATAAVFQAEHVLTRRVEAIKFLAYDTAADSEIERAFIREIEIQASLQHPNVAAVHNAFRTPEGLALVMELVDGEPLSSKFERGRIPLREGGQYILQALDALVYAHDHGVVHRDVKPSNIVVAWDGSVKLTDFGLARPLEDGQTACSGTLAGSPYYISPEQVLGLTPADSRSDCYSVGVILYEIATGSRPFEGESAFEVMLQHRETLPAAPLGIMPQIGAGLNTVILKAIEKDPARRFQSADEFRTALAKALANSPALRASRSTNALRNGRWFAAAAIAGLAASAAILVPVVRRPAPIHSVASPATMPPSPQPTEDSKRDPIVTVPATAPPSSVNPSRAAGQRRSVMHMAAAPVRSRKDVAAPAPQIVHTEPSPVIETKAVDIPTAPPAAEAMPVSQPAEAEPHPAGDADPHEALPPQTPKRRSLLRRAFGRIVHPWSGKSEPDRPQPANDRRGQFHP